MTKKEMTDELRGRMSQIIISALETEGFEVLQTAAGTFYVPCLDAIGDEAWTKFSVIIPKESEGDDGYALAEEYQLKLRAADEKKAKAQEKAAAAKAKREAKKNA